MINKMNTRLIEKLKNKERRKKYLKMLNFTFWLYAASLPVVILIAMNGFKKGTLSLETALFIGIIIIINMHSSKNELLACRLYVDLYDQKG